MHRGDLIAKNDKGAMNIMINLKLNNLKKLAAAGVFALALFMPVILCGCGGKKEGDELFLGMEAESETQSFTRSYDEKSDAALESAEPAEIYVYVCGAVEKPDVYRVDKGSRLFEVIELAGGFTPEADRAYLNLARNVADGEQIVVYTVEETAKGIAPVQENGTPGTSNADSGLVNINTASLKELTGIPGIGETRAQAIIDYRDKNGSFKSIEEIKKVDGIKDGLFSKIKDYITI